MSERNNQNSQNPNHAEQAASPELVMASFRYEYESLEAIPAEVLRFMDVTDSARQAVSDTYQDRRPRGSIDTKRRGFVFATQAYASADKGLDYHQTILLADRHNDAKIFAIGRKGNPPEAAGLGVTTQPASKDPKKRTLGDGHRFDYADRRVSFGAWEGDEDGSVAPQAHITIKRPMARDELPEGFLAYNPITPAEMLPADMAAITEATETIQRLATSYVGDFAVKESTMYPREYIEKLFSREHFVTES